MFCTATLGGQIIKIIYEKDNILIFTIRNVKGNKYEYYKNNDISICLFNIKNN